MKIDQQLWKRLGMGTSLAAIVLPLSGFFLEANAQTFNPPSGLGTPQRTAGGSRPMRSSCADLTQQAAFVALSPNRFTGTTASDHPTVWVSVPPTNAKTLEFSLFDAEQNGIYQTNIPIDSSTRMVKVTLPQTTATLTAGESYAWAAALVCDPQRRTEDWVATGWINKQPLSRNLQQQLTQASPEQQMKLYAQAGYWYETIDALVELRRSQPTNAKFATAWSDLLKIGGLPALNPPLSTAQAQR